MALPKEQKFIIYRGDPAQLTITLDGDYSGKEFLFGAKKDKNTTSQRLIEKSGVDISVTYNASQNKSTINILLAEEDTQDLTYNYLEYDLINITDNRTVARGKLYLEGDVITPYDGTDLPADAQRYIPYKINQLQDLQLLQYQASTGALIGKNPGEFVDENFYNKSEVDAKDNLLQAQITQEITDRANADNNLQIFVDENFYNKSEVDAKDNLLQAQITQEITDRANEDNLLQAQITQEITDRANADNNLQILIKRNYEFSFKINASTANYKIDDGTSSYYFLVSGRAGHAMTIDWGDGTTNTVTFTGSDQRVAKTYTLTGTYTVRIIGELYAWTRIYWAGFHCEFDVKQLPRYLTNIYIAGTNTIYGNIADLPAGVTVLNISGSNTLTGNIADAPAVVTELSIGGSNTLTGNIADLPAVVTYLSISGSNTLTGNIADLPAGLTYLVIGGSNTLTGNIADLPAGLTLLNIGGYNTLTGNIADAPAVVTYLSISGRNTLADYTAGRIWANNFRHLYLRPAAGYGLSSTEVDNLLIDLANVNTFTNEKQIDIAGNNAPRTSASGAAVSTLISKGVTVITNL